MLNHKYEKISSFTIAPPIFLNDKKNKTKFEKNIYYKKNQPIFSVSSCAPGIR